MTQHTLLIGSPKLRLGKCRFRQRWIPFVLYNAMNGLMYAIDWLFPYAGSMNYSQKFKYFISFYRIYIYIVKHWIESHKCWTQHNDYLIPNQPSPAIGWIKKSPLSRKWCFRNWHRLHFIAISSKPQENFHQLKIDSESFGALGIGAVHSKQHFDWGLEISMHLSHINQTG